MATQSPSQAVAALRPGSPPDAGLLKYLLEAPEEDTLPALVRLADDIRARYAGDEVHLRGVIEFSSHCSRNCHYCGLRSGNTTLTRYRIAPDDTVEIARRAVALGFRTIVLQSGEDPWYDAPTLAGIIEQIKALGAAVTVSVGDRPPEDYALFRQAGADRYLLKHETSDAILFQRLRPGTDLATRVDNLKHLRGLGFQIGAGNMVGLPGQSADSLVADLLLLQELEVDMAGIGPFIPHPQTPLADSRPGTVSATLRVLALARILMPWVHLPATSALGALDPQGRQKALRAGANVVMPNVTPAAYRNLYQIYPGKICTGEEPEHCRQCLTGIITGMGRVVATDCGHSLRPDRKECAQ
ncbi:MAG: [FeFe] hydrogenase H-cluster radical SAM maturase HydE [Bacillota bacterium]